MDKQTELEIVRLFNKPLHRPFAEIDKMLGLPTGTARQLLEEQKLFEPARFFLRGVIKNKRKK
jgi:hypothetical protein